MSTVGCGGHRIFIQQQLPGGLFQTGSKSQQKALPSLAELLLITFWYRNIPQNRSFLEGISLDKIISDS
jgi:hypothetical protein